MTALALLDAPPSRCQYAAGVKDMSKNVVNLDAMIPRQDMVDVQGNPVTSKLDKIDIQHLKPDAFFVNALRKPDFQRETARWSPDKVADLIRAFVDADLIPAVILWQRGQHVFVIDGAHRLGALIAWINDDYGDRRTSLEYFGSQIPQEQGEVAAITRKLVNQTVGPYDVFSAALKKQDPATQLMAKRLANLATNPIFAQWVPAVDEQSAEDSFFKINQAATFIDPTERRILKARRSPNAVAARAIVRGGTGHKYWSQYGHDAQLEIEATAKSLYRALYEPPLESPVNTLDVPIAGRGYNALPFVFDLVNLANNVPEPRRGQGDLPEDTDGSKTVEFLKRIQTVVQLLTGKQSSSLGVHPAVYFYTRGGEFQPNAFLAVADFVGKLSATGKLKAFTHARSRFEEFLVAHKEFISLTIKETGSGHRSLGRIVRYLEFVMQCAADGLDDPATVQALQRHTEFGYLGAKPFVPKGDNPSGKFSRRTKSASFLAAALASSMTCALCGARVHRNSMQIDHAKPKSEGGASDDSNAQVTHPYCNSAKATLWP